MEKKSTAFKIFYDAIELVDERKQDDEKSALELFKEALSNVMPHVEVRSRRVGGATFQIPMQIRPDRKVSLAMKWLITFLESVMRNLWPFVWPMKFLQLPKKKVLPSKNARILTKWLKQTKHFHTLDFNKTYIYT